MRILMLQTATGEQHAAFDQRLDDRLVGVALVALVVDDARRTPLPVRAETGRIGGEIAGIVDGERQTGVDAARGQAGG